MLLEIQNLHFSYSPLRPLLNNFNLHIEEGKIVALAGESGCGKSTLLNIIYGLLDWQEGKILFNGRELRGPRANLVPGESDMKLVAQNYDLMPYATVYDNVGKFLSNIYLDKKREKVMELLEVVGMQNYADEYPKNLSGGQQQRVAIARALSVTPKLLLLDEPFSNLDFSRKIELREKLFSYVKKENFSLIISTHDIPEIMPWLDQIIVLKDGRLIQNDTPAETYKHPYNLYVAHLFGEVNNFSQEETEKFHLRKKLWYPTEISIGETGFTAQVVECRFAGNYYWTKLNLAGKPLIYYSPKRLNESENIIIQFVDQD